MGEVCQTSGWHAGASLIGKAAPPTCGGVKTCGKVISFIFLYIEKREKLLQICDGSFFQGLKVELSRWKSDR